MKAADLLPRSLLPSVSTLFAGPARDEDILRITGLDREAWRDLGRAFPRLGSDPGHEAARARRRFRFLVGRALETQRHAPEICGHPASREPALYVTAHLGDLRSLRYILRRSTPAASVVASPEEERQQIAREDRAFDARAPQDFPHAFSSRRPLRLRSALRRGSLIAAADLPESGGVPFPCLGGRLALDPRPFRLARLADVPCRPLFLTAPRGSLTVTIGDRLASDDAAALESFARSLEGVADASPLDIDGPTWWNRLPRPCR